MSLFTFRTPRGLFGLVRPGLCLGIGMILSACGTGPVGSRSISPGVTFQEMTLPLHHANIAAFVWGSRQGGWLLLERESRRKNETWIYHASRYLGPRRFVAQNAIPHNMSLDFVSSRMGWAVEGCGVTLGYYAHYRIPMTDNGGKTWRRVDSLWMPAGPSSLAMLSASRGVLVGDPGGGLTEAGALTQDGGKHWSTLSVLKADPVGLGAALTATQATWLAAHTVMVVNGYWLDRHHEIMPILEAITLSIPQSTWHLMRLATNGLGGTVGALSFATPARGWMALAQRQGTVLVTTTNGRKRWIMATFGHHKRLRGGVRFLSRLNARQGCAATAMQLWCATRSSS